MSDKCVEENNMPCADKKIGDNNAPGTSHALKYPHFLLEILLISSTFIHRNTKLYTTKGQAGLDYNFILEYYTRTLPTLRHISISLYLSINHVLKQTFCLQIRSLYLIIQKLSHALL